jgi:Mce-associated membrane protein
MQSARRSVPAAAPEDEDFAAAPGDPGAPAAPGDPGAVSARAGEPAAEPGVADAADTVLADTELAGTVLADTVPADTELADTELADTVLAHTGHADAGRADPASADSAGAEAARSLVTDAETARVVTADASPRPRGAFVGRLLGLAPRTALAAAAGAAAIALGVFGIWATAAAHNLRASASGANAALVNAAATKAVAQDVTSAVDTIFSYSYADTARTRAAAQRLLTGQAISQYDQLFALVEQDAPKQKLVVTTRVTNIGVELLAGGRARLLVFANQQDTRAGTSQSSYGGAMFAVTAVSQHGVWKIESIDTFTGSA